MIIYKKNNLINRKMLGCLLIITILFSTALPVKAWLNVINNDDIREVEIILSRIDLMVCCLDEILLYDYLLVKYSSLQNDLKNLENEIELKILTALLNIILKQMDIIEDKILKGKEKLVQIKYKNFIILNNILIKAIENYERKGLLDTSIAFKFIEILNENNEHIQSNGFNVLTEIEDTELIVSNLALLQIEEMIDELSSKLRTIQDAGIEVELILYENSPAIPALVIGGVIIGFTVGVFQYIEALTLEEMLEITFGEELTLQSKIILYGVDAALPAALAAGSIIEFPVFFSSLAVYLGVSEITLLAMPGVVFGFLTINELMEEISLEKLREFKIHLIELSQEHDVINSLTETFLEDKINSIMITAPEDPPYESAFAELIANYVISEAEYEPSCDGYKWEYVTPISHTSFYPCEIANGAAGPGYFLLHLYIITRNPIYLQYAEGAARYILSNAISENEGYKWPHPDEELDNWWLSPVMAGIGQFLLELYGWTGNSDYLDYAKGAGNWLVSNVESEGSGMFIPYNPPGLYGSQASHGINPSREAQTALFLINLYQTTHDNSYLQVAEGTAEWLINGPDKLDENGGYKWRHGRPYIDIYPLRGTSEIADFFYYMHMILGKQEYLIHAEGAMQWILSKAEINGDICKWQEYDGKYYLLPFGGFFYGVESIPNSILLRHLEYADKHLNWVTSQGVFDGFGIKYPEYEGCTEYSYLQNWRVWNYLQNYEKYYLARDIYSWLFYQGVKSGNMIKWKTLPYDPYYSPLWSGSSVFGYYLLSIPG